MNNINVHSETRNGVTTFQGYVDRQQVIVISNNINSLGCNVFTVGSSSCLPSDLVKAKAYSDCIAQTFEAVFNHTNLKIGDRVRVKVVSFLRALVVRSYSLSLQALNVADVTELHSHASTIDMNWIKNNENHC